MLIKMLTDALAKHGFDYDIEARTSSFIQLTLLDQETQTPTHHTAQVYPDRDAGLLSFYTKGYYTTVTIIDDPAQIDTAIIGGLQLNKSVSTGRVIN